jgi:hypothetical protein
LRGNHRDGRIAHQTDSFSFNLSPPGMSPETTEVIARAQLLLHISAQICAETRKNCSLMREGMDLALELASELEFANRKAVVGARDGKRSLDRTVGGG